MTYIIRFFLLSMLLTAYIQPCSAQRYQDDDKKTITPSAHDTDTHRLQLPDKVYVGGSIGLLFGTTTYIDFSPIIGYEIKPRLLLGGGGSYTYLSYKLRDPYTGAVIDKESFSLYGAKMFARYTLPFLKSIFVEGDFLAMNVEDLTQPYYLHQRTWIFSPMPGIGLRSPLGEKSYYYLLILYDLNYQYNSAIFPVNSSPLVIRGGILF